MKALPIFNFNNKLLGGACFHILEASPELVSGNSYPFIGFSVKGEELGQFIYKVVAGFTGTWAELLSYEWLLHCDIGIADPDQAREYYHKWKPRPLETRMAALRLQKISGPPGFE